MSLNFIILVLAGLLPTIHSDCSVFDNEWKTCTPDMLPSSSLSNAYCINKDNTSAKVIIGDSRRKYAAVYCHNNTFPDNAFQCLPFGHIKLLILQNCPFPQNSFDKFFSNSTLNELVVLYPNSRILQTYLHLRNLPQLQYLSLKNLYTFSYFELVLNAVPFMTSIKIANFTFSSLPKRSFQELSLLRGLALTNGMIEVLPDDFLFGTNLRILDLSLNKIENFQPVLLKNMTELKRLNLSYNFLKTVDENLFKDTPRLEVLILQHNRIRSLPAALFKTTAGIIRFDASHNKLTEIPDNIFQGLDKMKYLRLSHNYLRVLSPNVLNNAKELILLELQYNQLRVIEDLLTSGSKLYKIELSNNRISRFSSPAPFGKSRSLQKVNLSNNFLEEVITLNWTLYNVTELDLSGNLIRELNLPTLTKPGGFILLQNNNISRVTVTKNLTSDYKYNLGGNPFDCSCDLSSFVSNLSVVIDNDALVCHEPWYRANKRLIDFQNKTELCEVNDDCPLECKCRLLLNSQIEVFCNNTGLNSAAILLPSQTTVLHLESNKIASLSDINEELWENLTRIYLSNNSLTSLQNWSVPVGLKLLAIDGNNLTKLPSSVMERISESEEFSVYLKGNNWPCDCQLIPLKMWMMENLSKVKDSQHTYCKAYKAYNNDKFSCPIAEIPLNELVCVDTQRSSQLSSTCTKSKIDIRVSVMFLISLTVVNKIY